MFSKRVFRLLLTISNLCAYSNSVDDLSTIPKTVITMATVIKINSIVALARLNCLANLRLLETNLNMNINQSIEFNFE